VIDKLVSHDKNALSYVFQKGGSIMTKIQHVDYQFGNNFLDRMELEVSVTS
jgi:hypothetical protein